MEEIKNAGPTDYKLFLLGGFGGLVFGASLGFILPNRIPYAEVKSGFVEPRKLEILVEDLVGNNQYETILRYNKERYLLILDETGKPKIVPYFVKPSQIVPKE